MNKKKRTYYSVRTGKNPHSKVDILVLRRLFLAVYQNFTQKNYFQEAFGYDCVDDDFVSGRAGFDVEIFFLRTLRKENLWPIEEKALDYTEDDLFDIIELLFDYISAPVDGYYHDYGNCGWHYKTFDQPKGQAEFRAKINEILADYGEGYTLSEQGEILILASPGLETLIDAPLPKYDPENVEARVESAKMKFRRSRSSLEDRRDAVRSLADVLEFLRPKLKRVLTRKDESDLFQLANKFSIRHHNVDQKTDYDPAIWLSWMFYYYLATIHAAVRLIEKHEESNP